MQKRRLVLLGFAVAVALVTLYKTLQTDVQTDVRRGQFQLYLPQQQSKHALPVTVVTGATNAHRKKLLAVVGVQTGIPLGSSQSAFDYTLRREALRSTWFPANQSALDRFEAQHNIVVRFVVGHSHHAPAEAALQQEQEQHGGFLRLPIYEGYMTLTNKTLHFLRAAVQLYDAQYIVKVDDDVYLRLDRLPSALRQWGEMQADYVGCMKTGQIVTSPQWKWYEPQHALLGDQSYFTHAWGPIYILSGRVAADLAAMRPGSLRFFINEDVTVGSWMLAFNTSHFDDRRLCETRCSPTSVAVYDMPQCSGLCEPVKSLPALHGSFACQGPPVPPGSADLPKLDPLIWL